MSTELLKEIGFKTLSKNDYLSLSNKASFENYDNSELSDNYWLIYEGDLTLKPEQIDLFDEVCIFITGNLTVEGIFNFQTIGVLFVLGDVIAESILLSSSICFFGGISSYKEALIVMGGSGAPVRIESPKGPFLYSDSDAAEITADPTLVNVFADYSYDESFGVVTDILNDEFLEVDEEYGEIDIEISDICDALLAGKSVLK